MTNIKQLVHTTLFFLKTTLFSIHVNPLLLTLIPFSLLCAVTKDLDKAGIMFCMILFTLTGVLLKPLSLDLKQKNGNGTNLNLFYKLLPLEKNTIHISLFLTILIYSLLLYIPFAILLNNSLSLPALDDLTVAYSSESHLSYLSGTYYGPRGLLHHFNENQYPSLLFGILKERSGWQLFPGALFLIPLLGCSGTIFILMSKIFNPKIRKGLFLISILTLSSLITLSVLFMGDLFLPAWSIGEIRITMERIHAEMIISTLLSITAISLISGSIFILKKTNKETSHV